MNADAVLRHLASSQLGLLTTAEAHASGVSKAQLAGRVASGALVPIHRGVYRLAAAPEASVQAALAAALAAGDGAVVFRRAAALVHGFDAGEFAAEVAIPPARRVTIPGITVMRTDLQERADTQRFHSVRVTNPTRTIIDLAAVTPRKRLGVVLDDALARRLTAVPLLERRLAALAPQRRAGRATLIELLAERRGKGARFRRGLEIEVLEIIRKAKLPEPSLQHEVRRPSGRKAKIDVAYPDHKLAIEVDSYRHHAELTAWSADTTRGNELVVLGWRILHIPEDMVRDRPGEILALVRDALGREV